MASLAMANSIRLSGLLGWDYGSKSSVVSDINCRVCSCSLLDSGQNLCRFVFVFVVAAVVVVVSLFCFSALLVGCFAVTNVIFASLSVGFYEVILHYQCGSRTFNK